MPRGDILAGGEKRALVAVGEDPFSCELIRAQKRTLRSALRN